MINSRERRRTFTWFSDEIHEIYAPISPSKSPSKLMHKMMDSVRSNCDRQLLRLILIAIILICGSQSAQASSSTGPNTSAAQAVLLDTTEQSSLGWTKYPDGGPGTRMPGWVEESFTNFERNINWRSFVVCDVAFNSVNNWLWTPFIERGEANRLYIEIKFTMRDCNLFPQEVRSCKETFALLYKEMDSPIDAPPSIIGAEHIQQGTGNHLGSTANASFAQSDSYTLIDAIAADEGRFTSNTDVVINTEIRSIPVSKRGVYFAFRDQGACLSLISIKVYHIRCPALTTSFAHFNATPTGRDLTSLVAVEGQCVANSVQIEQPKMFCTADGNWNSMSSGQCKCLAGFEPSANQTKCQACPPHRYKSSLGDSNCVFCPDKSSAPYAAASECKCHEGYFRASKDPRSAPCTQPPGAPYNLSATYVDSTSVILQWQAPKYTGNRQDLTYKLQCENCDQTLVSSPQFYTNFSETKCVLSGLSPSTTYRFLVYAMNGVSHLATQSNGQQPQYSEISLQTARPIAQTATNTLSSQGNLQLLPIYNFRALNGARGSDMILQWDAQSLPSDMSSLVIPLDTSSMDSSQLQLPSLYEIRYQPRYSTSGHSSLDSGSYRRSPYPASLIGAGNGQSMYDSNANHLQQQQQSITTTNRALSINTLIPRTEYAFQIRAKWSHTNQWTEFSEPIYAVTSNQLTPIVPNQMPSDYLLGSLPDLQQVTPFLQQSLIPNQQQQQSGSSSSSSSWWATLLLVLFCALVSLAFVSVTVIHYRKSLCLQSLAGGFGHLSAGSAGSAAYAGVYGSGASSDLMGVGGFGGGGTASSVIVNGNGGSSIIGPNHHHTLLHNGHAHPGLHHATLSAGSAGGLITGTNTANHRSSSGNVVQNFIAATLSQISGHHNGHSGQHLKHQQHSGNTTTITHHNLTDGGGVVGGGGGGKQLFANPAMTNQQQQRNLYHQTLGHLNNSNHLNNTLSATNQNNHNFQLTPTSNGIHNQLPLANGTAANQQDVFKYRTLAQSGAQFNGIQHQLQQQHQQDLHIYDDLESTCGMANVHQQQQQIQASNRQQQSPQNEIDPQRVTIESVIGRGEYHVDVSNWIRSATYETYAGQR